jgi:hypothetical protein
MIFFRKTLKIENFEKSKKGKIRKMENQERERLPDFQKSNPCNLRPFF